MLYNFKRFLLKVFAPIIELIRIPLYPFKYIFFYLYLKLYLFSRGINTQNYILFAHGSVSDTVYMASLLDAFFLRYGKSYVIASKENIDIFRVYTDTNVIQFLFETENKCRKLRTAITIAGNYKSKNLEPGIIRPLHGVLYSYFYELTLTNRLSYRDMITWIMGLDKHTPFNYITSYSNDDYNKAKELLSSTGHEISEIALINPICYTHKNLSSNAWEGIAEALFIKGFYPIFNLKSKIGEENEFLSPKGYQTVNIPSYMVPLCSEMVGFCCARLGGGFDLLQSYSKKENNCLLILLSNKVKLLENEKEDHVRDIIEEYFLSFSGRFSSKIAILDSVNSKDEAFNKVMLSLNS